MAGEIRTSFVSDLFIYAFFTQQCIICIAAASYFERLHIKYGNKYACMHVCIYGCIYTHTGVT